MKFSEPEIVKDAVWRQFRRPQLNSTVYVSIQVDVYNQTTPTRAAVTATVEAECR